MTEQEFRRLQPGDLVRHVEGGDAYVVTGNYGGRVTAVRSVDLTHADEWRLALKVRYEAPEAVP